MKSSSFAGNVYLALSALFIASLVASNLIFQKFFYWNPWGLFNFEISVGLLPYPVTFLITDTISEIYGKEKANKLVLAGIFASFFSLLIIFIGDIVPATSWSRVNDATYTTVFGLSPLAVLASMLAYLAAQFCDIRVYHFWKKITKGKHMWLRNNASTFTSQFIDTLLVLLFLCSFDVIPWTSFKTLLISGFLFKIIVASLDTPLLYLIVFYLRKKIGIKGTKEITTPIL